jgi:hypothetical protein
MRESELVASILDYLAKRQIFHYRQNTGAFQRDDGHFYRFGAKGSPDIVCIIAGRYVGIEAKTATGTLSDDQVAFHRNAMVAGGIVFTVRTLDEAIEAVEDTKARLERNAGLRAA